MTTFFNRHAAAVLAVVLSAAAAAHAETVKIEPITVPEWKAVYGEVKARDTVPARARIGGTLQALTVTEGDAVTEGDVIARVEDDKLDYQIKAYEAELKGLDASLENARSEYDRGEQLNRRGALSNQQLDTLRTQVDVVTNNIASARANMAVVQQQLREGDVLAPASGKVLTVPLVEGSVIQTGETVATIGSGGFYLRLAVPERHASTLEAGAEIEISRPGEETYVTGRLVKLYPQLENNRVIADVEVEGLRVNYVNQRFLVRVPIGERTALMVPVRAVSTRHGLDFVTVAMSGGQTREKSVITGQKARISGTDMIEVLTGLAPGDEVILP